MATHSSLLASRIPRTEEPGGLQSRGFQESDTTERLSTTVPKEETVSLHYIKNLYLFSFGCAASSLLGGLLSGGEHRPLSGWMCPLLNVGSFSWRRAQVLGPEGFSSCGTWGQQLWLPGSRAQAQQLWHMSLAALQHVPSCWVRDRSPVSSIGRRVLYQSHRPLFTY